MILGIKGTEKDTLVFYSTGNSDKVNGAGNVGQGYRVSMPRTIIMQGFMILGIIGTEKDTLVFYLT